MSRIFKTDERGLIFLICKDDTVKVLAKSSIPDGIDQEISIPKEDFQELINFVDSLSSYNLFTLMYETEKHLGASIRYNTLQVMNNPCRGFEPKFCIAFTGKDSELDTKTLAFRFDLPALGAFQEYLQPFKELLDKPSKVIENVKTFKYKANLIVEAVPYVLGMEDGVEISMRSRLDGHIEHFIVRDTIKENGATVRDNVERLYANNKAYDVEEYKPFIDYCDHRHYIEKTDMIVTDALGDIFPMSLKVFNATFEEDR